MRNFTQASLSVRKLTADDAAQYRTVRLHGLQHDALAFAAAYADECDRSISEFANRISSTASPSAVFGAFLSEKLVGIVGFNANDAENMRHKGTLWGMYALPEVRRLGVGRALMSHLLTHVKEETEIEKICLAVTRSNTKICAWYEALGFRLYGIECQAVKIDGQYGDDELRSLIIVR